MRKIYLAIFITLLFIKTNAQAIDSFPIKIIPNGYKGNFALDNNILFWFDSSDVPAIRYLFPGSQHFLEIGVITSDAHTPITTAIYFDLNDSGGIENCNNLDAITIEEDNKTHIKNIIKLKTVSIHINTLDYKNKYHLSSKHKDYTPSDYTDSIIKLVPNQQYYLDDGLFADPNYNPFSAFFFTINKNGKVKIPKKYKESAIGGLNRLTLKTCKEKIDPKKISNGLPVLLLDTTMIIEATDVVFIQGLYVRVSWGPSPEQNFYFVPGKKSCWQRARLKHSL